MAYRKGSGQPAPRNGETLSGMVKSYNRKGFGFIMCQALNADVYFSRESVAPALQTSDLAGEYVTFEVNRFPDGKFSAVNLRPANGDTGLTRGPDGKGGAAREAAREAPSKGFSKGPPTGAGGAQDEDRSRDWYCENCRERNFLKRLECFKCKAPKPRDADSEPVVPQAAPRRTLSPHAGSRAVRDMLRKGGGKGRGVADRSRSRSGRGTRRSSSRRRPRKSRSASKSSSSSSHKKKSSSSSSSSESPDEKARSDAEGKDKAPQNPEIEKAKADALQQLLKLQKMEDREARIREWRALLRQWHPDKNPERTEVATAVFQFLQKGKTLIDTEQK